MGPELMLRILCDFVPHHLDAVHLVGQTADNESSVIEKAIQVERAGGCDEFTMMDKAVSGYPGGNAWESQIRAQGATTPITRLSFPTPDDTNTYGEALSFIAEAKKREWKKVGIIAQPLHQPRAFCTFVGVVCATLPSLQIYSITGCPLDWSTPVTHSQGSLKGTRAQLIGNEVTRVATYQQNGTVPSEETVIVYLNRRDAVR